VAGGTAGGTTTRSSVAHVPTRLFGVSNCRRVGDSEYTLPAASAPFTLVLPFRTGLSEISLLKKTNGTANQKFVWILLSLG
jgi:hypothetical protein